MIIQTCERWSQKFLKSYFMQLMVNLMHEGCSFEDISPPPPISFCVKCLPDQCLLKLLVLPCSVTVG